MPVRPIPQELYEKMISYYRERPGEVRGCAELCGVHEKTARRAWRGPAWSLYGYEGIPAQEVFAREAAARTAMQATEEEQKRLTLTKEAEKQAGLEADARKFEEGSLRLARGNLIVAGASLAKLSKGVAALADRVNEVLEKPPTGADGKPIPIDPIKGMATIRAFTYAVHALNESVETLLTIGRLQQGKPTSLHALAVIEMSTEQIADEVARAQASLKRAKGFGLRLKGGSIETQGVPMPPEPQGQAASEPEPEGGDDDYEPSEEEGAQYGTEGTV